MLITFDKNTKLYFLIVLIGITVCKIVKSLIQNQLQGVEESGTETVIISRKRE